MPDKSLGARCRALHGECARDVLHGYFPAELAEFLLWEYTCFPMDCDVASAQAHALIVEDIGRLMAL